MALVAYGILNATLYASLLPLWEGFDEPFHYGYVEHLEKYREFPELGKTPLSGQVWTSLHLAPASRAVKDNLPWAIAFDEYFRMPQFQRERMRLELEGLSLSGSSNSLNYEAHQPPLAYLLLATADNFWSSASLPTRVWRLRLLCAVFASVGTIFFLSRLARRLGMSRLDEQSLLFVVLSLQMFYATTAHISNDWLAVPVMVALFERLLAAQERPTSYNMVTLAGLFAAGLLTKAYLLALVPVVFAVLLALVKQRRMNWRKIALFTAPVLVACGPWYVRNLRLYGNLSGMQETAGGTDWAGLTAAFLHVPWLRSATDLMFSSLWTGNNSITTFSSVTLSMLLAGVFAASLVYLFVLVKKPPPRGESIVLLGCAAYLVALAYSTTVTFWFTKGKALTVSPWYTQPFLLLLLALLFCGLARDRAQGKWIQAWLVCWSGYIISATYWAKLIPLYAGYPHGRIVLFQLAAWYRSDRPQMMALLSTTVMARPGTIFALAAAVVVAAIALSISLSILHFRSGGFE